MEAQSIIRVGELLRSPVRWALTELIREGLTSATYLATQHEWLKAEYNREQRRQIKPNSLPQDRTHRTRDGRISGLRTTAIGLRPAASSNRSA